MNQVPDSKMIRAGSSTYFIDLKKAKNDAPYLLISESVFKGDSEKRERSSIRLFPENAEEFLSALNEMAEKLQ